MVTANAARNIVGIIGNVISFGMFISPVPTFYKIYKKRDVEQFSPMPYLAALLNCSMWTFYGLPFVTPNSVLVSTINGTGAALEIIYLSMYLAFSKGRQRMRALRLVAVELVFVALVFILVLTLTHNHKKRKLIIGTIGAVFSTCMYASPLSVMKMVIQTKSVKYMPFYLSLASFVNSVCWMAYALIIFDVFIEIPNALGTLFGAAQLVLYGCYYRTTNWDEEDEKPQSGLELPTTKSTATISSGSV